MDQDDHNDSITFDESKRYDHRSILRSERVYGAGFQSARGAETTERFAATLDVARRPGVRVLDIGSGLGGAAIHLATTYGCKVTGVDSAQAMVDLSSERVRKRGLSDIRFLRANATDDALFAEDMFDVIWSMDCMLYVDDKESIWTNALRWLAPGGQLFVTDFGCGNEDDLSAEFRAYVADCDYHLQDLHSYQQTVRRVGFSAIEAEDRTARFIEANNLDREKLERERDDFLSEFDESELEHLTERWEKKIRLAEAGDLCWFVLQARKARPV